MAGVRPVADPPDLDAPVLVEGLPGVGLVGKIATDHLVERFDMSYVAAVECGGLPEVAVYVAGERAVRSPVRIYADEERDLLALQSDVPVSRTAASGFADCVTTWLEERGAFPLYLTGIPVEDGDPDAVPAVSGVGVGDGVARLDDAGVGLPDEDAAVGGPTGALLQAANRRELDAAGVVVETDPRFPDPAAARRLLLDAVEPLAGVSVDTESLVEHAEEIQEQREALARQMREAAEEESSQATPLRGFQ